MKKRPSVILINLLLLSLGLVLAFGFFGLGQAEAALYPAAKIIVLTGDSAARNSGSQQPVRLVESGAQRYRLWP
ncbi:MAG: hypothetical protein PWQ99_423 [Clostridia bacterium]|jgi:hypothetical protein|nr:hypothetical protein [Clostridia bacterium]